MSLPRTPFSLAAVVASSLALPLAAQTVSCSAIETSDGYVRAEHVGVASPVMKTIPAGQDLSGGLSLSVDSGVAHGLLTCKLTQDAIITFESRVFCQATTMGTPGGADLASEAGILLTFTAQQPVHGVIAVTVQSQPSGGWPGLGNFAVDLDADGSIDVTGNPYGSPPFVTYLEFSRTFGPGTLPIVITHHGAIGMPANSIGEYMAYLNVRWFPDTGPVTSYGTPCGIALNDQRLASGDLVFSLYPAPNFDTWLLFGLTPRNTPIALPPFCMQWTDFASAMWWGGGQVVVPNVPLPVGFAINAQAVKFVDPTTTYLSNGLSMIVGL